MEHKMICRLISAVILISHYFMVVESGEMTFELPDKEKMCFNEVIEKGVKSVLEFQVIEGGNYDVDLTLTSVQSKAVLYKVKKKQYDHFEWTADVSGEFQFCFSNEFSSITHKIIYFDLQVGDEEEIRASADPLTAMTQMETSVASVHNNLKIITDYQTHHRLRETQGRSFAEDLNERVMYWSVGQAAVIIIVSIGQIFILRSFFTERKPVALHYHVPT